MTAYDGISLADLAIHDVVWTSGRTAHIRSRTVRYGANDVDIDPTWASEAAIDGWALRAPDPASRTGESIRGIGYSPSARRTLMVVIIPDEHPPTGLWWGITARPANRAERNGYERSRP